MSKKTCIRSIAAIVGAALAGSISAVDLASAAENPFDASQSQSDHMILASAEEEGKCGEGKEAEGKCGEGKETEGKCGEGKSADEATSGSATKEGKCGEGKCGSE